MRHGENEVGLQALHRTPPATDSVVVKLEGGSAANVKNGTEELFEIKWDYHIVITRA